VIYAARSLLLAMLEQLAQAGTGRLPRIEIMIPDSVPTETVQPTALPEWDAADRLASRAFGDRWIAEQRSCVLLTPSVIVPKEQNVVINPAHTDFVRVTASTPRPLNWDERLKAFVAQRPI
jgi:RES domain-containing protein